eukprot:TRINITY_DN9092_c0_g1_i1.p1 TRINITY_DN9092_c0_g1~~TRINITY_DN9092_c0_g1_i1.p1  ORF type:complete len:558 (+),score=146.80 TRINITY_DN9092_c0_g1_i1:37-1710(+)
MPTKKKYNELSSNSSDGDSDSSHTVESPVLKKPKLSAKPSKGKKVLLEDEDDDLGVLFSGAPEWEKAIVPIIKRQPNWEKFLGMARDKEIVPIRELTFQALKPNEPGDWKVVVFGQNPYPRMESATGIAMFDNSLKTWDDKRFGSVSTMRCIIKAACMSKFNAPKVTPVAELRKILKANQIVGPAEWFQAMLTQGVLLLNASLTTNPSDKSKSEHLKFSVPIIEGIMETVLQSKTENKTGLVFAWWGAESLKVKAKLNPLFLKYRNKVEIRHIDHPNPAAQGDIFCSTPTPFDVLNNCLKELKLREIDWLPNQSWKGAEHHETERVNKMGDFMAATMNLHKMYLDRLKDGLTVEELRPITGIGKQKLLSLVDTCSEIGLETAAEDSLKLMKKRNLGALTLDEGASIHMYTGQSLYRKLNNTLRDPDRKKVVPYMSYLKLLFTAIMKLPVEVRSVYRGVGLDLAKQYPKGSTVTWWAVNSCTPDLKVANNFLGKSGPRTLFKISGSTLAAIKQYSAYKAEEELILLPGVQLKVTSTENKGSGLTEIYLTEVEGERLVN